MSLNITAKRRADLSDYGTGWEGCYLTVKSMNPKELKDWQAAAEDKDSTQTVDEVYGDLLKRICEGGVIMNTDDDGKSQKYTFGMEDVDDVVDQISPAFKQRALMVAAGTYGLKGL